MSISIRSILVLAAVTIFCGDAAAQELISESTTWTRESDGKKIEAILLRVADEEKTAVLKTGDDKEYNVPISLLIAEDRKRIRNAAAKARIDKRMKEFHEKNPDAKQLTREIIERVKRAEAMDQQNGLFGFTVEEMERYLGERKPVKVKNSSIFKDHALFRPDHSDVMILAGFHSGKCEYFSVQKNEVAEEKTFVEDDVSFILDLLGGVEPAWKPYQESAEKFLRSDGATAEVTNERKKIILMSGAGMDLIAKPE